MDDPRKYPEEVKECWALHQVFRSLGYPPGDIYIVLSQDEACSYPNSSLFVLLKEGSLEFLYTLKNYKTEEEAKKIMSTWTEFVTRFNAQEFDQKIMGEIFDRSSVMRDKMRLLRAMQRKGFSLGYGVN